MAKVRIIQLEKNYSDKIVEDKRNAYVSYGIDNKFPDFLLELSTKSGLHTAILDKKVKMDCGNGIVPASTDKKTEKWLKNVNKYESIDKISNKIFTDLEIYGGSYLQIVWSKDGKIIAEMYHVPFNRIRTGKLDENNQITSYFYSNKWSKHTKDVDIKKFPAFSTEKNKGQIQILAMNKYNPASFYYPLPSYIGAVQSIDTLGEIENFHNSAIKNNFAPGAMIIFKDKTTEEEMDDVVEQIENKYKGSNRAGEPIIFFIDENQPEPSITQLTVSDLDKQFDLLSQTADKNVTLAHSIPRIIAGLETPGSLGGGKEYIDASMVFFNQYISKQQDFILEYLNKISEINGMSELKIVNANPSIMLYSENLLANILTQDEIRELFGFEPIKVEEVTVVEDNNNPVIPETNEQ